MSTRPEATATFGAGTAGAGPADPGRPMRADARRNYDRLVAVATEVFAEQGADAALDEITRRAGVGPGTLYRHFPNRSALLEAVFQVRVQAMAARARELVADQAPLDALTGWMRLFVAHVSEYRGLGLALMDALGETDCGPGRPPDDVNGTRFLALCHGTLRDAAAHVLAPAQAAGVVRSDLTAAEILRVGNVVALATESSPDRETEADRYLTLILDGLRGR